MNDKKFVNAAQLKSVAEKQKAYIDASVEKAKSEHAQPADDADIKEIEDLFAVAQEGAE